MVTSQEVIALIKKAIPDALITVEDLGGGDHLEINVVSNTFSGLSLSNLIFFLIVLRPLLLRIEL